MNWYLAKITYRIVCGKGKHMPQFDEQLRLLSALNDEQALVKAKLLGASGAQTFYNDLQQLVQWQFINVTELHCISEWTDGAEVYSSITETENADDYINLVGDKAMLLQHRHHS